jgi:hypothetical protein
MCEYSGRLIAWLDGELQDDEATNVEWHVSAVRRVPESGELGIEQVSGAFLACYQGGMSEDGTRRSVHPWGWAGRI